MEKYSLCNYEFIPNKKLIGQTIQKKRREMGITAAKLSEVYGLYVFERTINSWEQGRTRPNIDFLIQLSKIFNITLDELVVPKSKFYKEDINYSGELNIDLYNCIWFYIEKHIFSFLGMFEKKRFIIDFLRRLTFCENKLDMDVLLGDYENECKEKYGPKYKVSASKTQREEIMYDLRRKIKVYDDEGSLFYTNLYYKGRQFAEDFDKLSDFDKTFLSTAISISEYKGFFKSCVLEEFLKGNSYVLDIEKDEKVDTFESAVDYIYEILGKHDYLWFKSNLKKY